MYQQTGLAQPTPSAEAYQKGRDSYQPAQTGNYTGGKALVVPADGSDYAEVWSKPTLRVEEWLTGRVHKRSPVDIVAVSSWAGRPSMYRIRKDSLVGWIEAKNLAHVKTDPDLPRTEAESDPVPDPARNGQPSPGRRLPGQGPRPDLVSHPPKEKKKNTFQTLIGYALIGVALTMVFNLPGAKT